MMTRITTTIALLESGDRQGARQSFAELWSEIGEDGDPLQRCTLAHYMADAQDDVADELAWDLRALEAADQLTDERVRAHHESITVASFYPSLHLNLAEDYRRLGDLAMARQHCTRAESWLSALPSTELGAMLRGGIARMATLLSRPRP
jgi:hypothetical protein